MPVLPLAGIAATVTMILRLKAGSVLIGLVVLAVGGVAYVLLDRRREPFTR